MDYARDLHSGKVVAAGEASLLSLYACPRPGCGGRVYLPEVVIQRPHFRHYPGEGSPACDEYFPGARHGGEGGASLVLGVEEDPSELGLGLTQVDGRWGLGLRLPEIPGDELGETALGALRSALVDVHTGPDLLLRVSALDLRPGVGAACADVAPSLQAFRTQPAGSWPNTVNKERWLLQARGLEAKGTLFRLRRGEWMRLLANSGVHHGESYLVLADARCAPPDSIVIQTHARLSAGGSSWTILEVRLPNESVVSVSAWLARLGHVLVPRPWSIELATPARSLSEGGEPVFWVDDSPVLTLGAPQHDAVAMVAFNSGANIFSASVRASPSHTAHVGIKARDAGLTRLTVASQRSASLNVAFSQRPSRAALLELLVQTRRLRVWIDEQVIEAWQGSTHRVLVTAGKLPEVRVDVGAGSARVRITVWERGKQCSRRGLDARSTERGIVAALPNASRIEIDADNLGRIELVPMLATADTPRKSAMGDRLAWHDHVVSLRLRPEDRTSPTLLVQPAAAMSLVPRQVGPATLVRSRLVLRRRREAGGTGP